MAGLLRRPASRRPAPRRPAPRWLPGRGKSGVGLTVVAMCVLLTACGTTTAPTENGPTITITVTATATATVTLSSAAPATAVPTPDSTAHVLSSPPAPGGTPAQVTVPNGVGLNYQQAQDEWRGAGLHVAPAVDGTGAHRLPVLDSNWVVLSQDLAAGSKVAADSFITATVKKFTDG